MPKHTQHSQKKKKKCPISLERVEWFFWMWLFASCSIATEAKKIYYFLLELSDIGCHPIRFSDVLNLKNLKAIWGIKLIFCFNWSLNTFGQSVCRSFYFSLVWFIYLNAGGPFLHYKLVLLHFFCKVPFATEAAAVSLIVTVHGSQVTWKHSLDLLVFQEEYSKNLPSAQLLRAMLSRTLYIMEYWDASYSS